jgi:hypothetical protein
VLTSLFAVSGSIDRFNSQSIFHALLYSKACVPTTGARDQDQDAGEACGETLGDRLDIDEVKGAFWPEASDELISVITLSAREPE